MSNDAFDGASLLQLEGKLWIVARPTGVPIYDFTFEHMFACRHAWRLNEPVTAIARMGTAEDYAQRYADFAAMGIRLVHTPDTYALTSHLPLWYPRLEGLTPRSVWFDVLPSAGEVEAHFDWPVFIKGERQTNRHSRKQSIIESRSHFEEVMAQWRREPILAWQRVVCREYVPLRMVTADDGHGLPRSFEFRTFWWRHQCVGIGRYWLSESYAANATELAAIERVAGEAARRLDVSFLVVDVAQTQQGEWIVIEVNDGQDSGYAGVNPMVMWRNVLACL